MKKKLSLLIILLSTLTFPLFGSDKEPKIACSGFNGKKFKIYAKTTKKGRDKKAAQDAAEKAERERQKSLEKKALERKAAAQEADRIGKERSENVYGNVLIGRRVVPIEPTQPNNGKHKKKKKK